VTWSPGEQLVQRSEIEEASLFGAAERSLEAIGSEHRGKIEQGAGNRGNGDPV
jgi:hypothetical protein